MDHSKRVKSVLFVTLLAFWSVFCGGVFSIVADVKNGEAVKQQCHPLRVKAIHMISHAFDPDKAKFPSKFDKVFLSKLTWFSIYIGTIFTASE